MEPQDDIWAEVADRFVEAHYRSIRGRVRRHVIDRHLATYLPGPPASIVDVGGGAGTQSLPLAARGYYITIVDSSPAMLERAAAALSRQPDDVASRVRLVEAKGEDAGGSLGGEVFEGVLCHGVLPYVNDPSPLVASLGTLCAPRGVVSVVAKNMANLAVAHALRGEWAEALGAFDSSRQVNSLGFDTRADAVEDLSSLFVQHGVEPLAWFGVRLFVDGWTDPESVPDDVDDLMAVELEASRRDPYRHLSRLFHLIGRKVAPEDAAPMPIRSIHPEGWGA